MTPEETLEGVRGERDHLKAALATWTEVQPCRIEHQEPYDFRWCETHDRTFPLDGDCDHRGLCEIDYLTDKESRQRSRAIFAEGQAVEAEAQVQRVLELHTPFEWSFGFGPVKTCRECARLGASEADAAWPCATRRAVDGPAGE